MYFSQRWFEDLAKFNFDNFKKNFDGRPINYLEIGCYEGNCHLYMYENILTHPDSKSTVIEPWGGGTGSSTHNDASHIFLHNLTNYLYKIQICRGLSNDYLPKLIKNSYDIIYIDGDHASLQTYTDGMLSWDLLKKNGILIFDDYIWHRFRIIEPHIPPGYAIGEDMSPAKGINQFLLEKQGQYELFGQKEGFDKECKIIDLNLINDINTVPNLNDYNRQIWIRKTVD